MDEVIAELNKLVARRELTGVVAAVWHRNALLFNAHLGFSNLARTESMRADTLFRIASMTKPITSVAALMLLERGVFDLGDSIAKWLPELTQLRVLRSVASKLDDVVDIKKPITVLDLMTHRAGFGYGFSTAGPLGAAYDAALESPFHCDHSRDQWIKNLSRLPLLHPPGERFSYGHSTDVLGVLMERATDTPLDELVSSLVLEPLEMTDTFFQVPAADLPRVAENYEYDSVSGTLKNVWWLRSASPPPRFAAGGQGLWSTVPDYLRFARLLLGRGQLDGLRLISEQSFEKFTRNALTSIQREDLVLGTAIWRSLGYGLGVATLTHPENVMSPYPGNAGAITWPGILGTWWQVDPKADAILLYFTGLVSLSAVAELAPGARGQSIFRDEVYRRIV